jgi:hypothetical protein
MECANYLKVDILEPGKKYLDEQNNTGKNLYNEIKKTEKEYKDAMVNLEKVIFYII